MNKNIHINFMCVGFQKCGTTLLQEILAQNKEIFLPERKETWFFQWKDSCQNPLYKLKKDFFSNAPEEKKWGIIDPTFIREPRRINYYFGKDCKIIFMLRNPINAVYSDFKMKMRTCQDDYVIHLYQKYGYQNIKGMFDEYIQNSIRERKLEKHYFSNTIKKYYRFFQKENIYIILFEELLLNPEEELKKLELFLNTKNYNYKIEKVNDGGTVSRNYICALMNKFFFRVYMKLYAVAMNDKKRKQIDRIRDKFFDITHIEFKQAMSEKSKGVLERYFFEERNIIMDLTGKELKEFWF